MISFDEVDVGTEVPAQTFQVKRANLVQYCGASGDFRESGAIRGDHRKAVRHGFENGNAETLIETGKREESRTAV